MPSGVSISQLWSGTLSGSGPAYTVTNLAWNGSVGAVAAVAYGFTGAGAAPGSMTVECSWRLARLGRPAPEPVRQGRYA